MKKTKVSINTKIKYTDSSNYQKHFCLDDRIKIQKLITEYRDENGNMSIMLKDIGNIMSNDPSTISKEVKLHRIFKGRNKDSRLGAYNSICSNYKNCKIPVGDFYHPHSLLKTTCKCVDRCNSFEEIKCPHLKKFPWVCNGCPKASSCYLNKYYYYADIAEKDYKQTLKETREGINLTPDEFKVVNHVVSSYVKVGQPIYHIFASNDLPVSQRTVYNYFEKGYLDAKNIDLRRKVSYKKRYQHKTDKAILKRIKQGRTYEDYQEYVKLNPDASIVEMDTVISAGDSRKVLLTFHFVKYHFQLAYILESKEVLNVTACINDLCNRIGLANFQKMFEVILTDNGTEFSDPESIEFEPENGELRCKVFYCHPYASREKGHCEKNHEYIRYILPKGTVFDFLTQDMCDLMMSHINSTKRPSVKGTPYDFMALAFGKEVLDLLKIKKIDSNLVTLLPTLLTK